MDRLLDEKQMTRQYEFNQLSSQYVISLFAEEYEKNLFEAYSQKNLLNGQVPSLVDYNLSTEIREETDKLFDVFYNGEPLTDFERDLEKRYLALKYQKFLKYKQRKHDKYKVNWTLNDVNRYQEQINYRMNDMSYNAKPRAISKPFDMDNALVSLNTYMDIQDYGKIKRWWTYLNDMKLYERGRHRSALQAA